MNSTSMITAGIARTVLISLGSVILFLVIVLLSSTSIQKRWEIKEGNLSDISNRYKENLSKNDYEENYFSDNVIDSGKTTDLINCNKSDVFETNQTTSKIEYIVPKKLSPTSLHQDDILYSSDIQQFQDNATDGDSMPSKHHSGHFRPNTAEIWDPDPEYQFTAFGRVFHLILKHDSDFVVPNLKVTHISGNFSQKFSPNIKPNGCYYSGYLKDIPHSIVVVSLCNGMKGHINTNDGGYFIEPAEPPKGVAESFLHSIYKISVDKFAGDSGDEYELESMEDIDDNSIRDDDFDNFEEFEENYKNESSFVHFDENIRKKRSTESYSEYVVELLIAVDKKMADYHGTDLHNYVLTLMSIVAKIYKDKTIGHPIHISVVRLIVLNNSEFTWPSKITIGSGHNSAGDKANVFTSRLLDGFCSWQSSMYDAKDPRSTRHDSALLLTREYVCGQHNKCDNTLGLARLGTMCQQDSCAVVRDNGLSAAFTIAHELGHVLNMQHDGDAKCNKFRQKGWRLRVMSHVLDQNTHPWSWSLCSRHYLTEYLDGPHAECMKDGLPSIDLFEDSTYNSALPGEKYTHDRQCELIYGNGSRTCSDLQVCQSLWCAKEMEPCHTHHMPWAEGTVCGENQWCQQGECVAIDRNSLLPVDGGWGNWQPYGDCSRVCGGGIRKSYRECDNPPPRNGGKYCLGKRVRYQSCGTEECPPDELDFRSQQCAKFNNKTFNIHNLTGDVQWVPKYGGRREDRCKLHCRVSHSTEFYPLQDKVIDGTRCGPDTFDICVNGVCEKAGCDHILDSNMKLDMCSVCGGDNTSCKQIYNRHNSSHYGYNHLVTLPAGASNLDIRQHSHQNSHKDGNYLALLDPETGEYILNGNFIVSPLRKILRYGGVNIEYSGSNSVVERINSSLPLNTELVVELLSIGNLHPPDVVYHYTIPRSLSEYFKWEVTDEWTQCDKVCHGDQERVIRCVRKDIRQFVSAESCIELTKPGTETRPCNEHCILRWKMVGQSECSSHCGEGTRALTYQCVQEFRYSYTKASSLPDSSCSHITKPQEIQRCTGPCDEARWRYSDWQPCSVTCGPGLQTRVAECVDDLGRPMDEYKCSSSEKIIQRVCNNGKCPEWYTGKWSTCNGLCGTGERTRQIWCRKEDRVVSTSLCDFTRKPMEKEPCRLPACSSWIAKEWSSCSVTCGVGTITRIVRCSSPHENACPEDQKPASVETCTLPPCPHENEIPDTYNSDNIKNSSPYKWQAGEWEQCSKTCGSGYKTRSVRCYDTIVRKVVDKQYCYHETLPQITDLCYGPPCTAWKTLSWSACSATCGEGISVRTLKCVSLQTLDELPASECSNLEKPEMTVPCQASHSCKSTTSASAIYNWRTGRWGECSASCGGGMQVRAVACQNEEGGIGYNCRAPKPESTAPCNTQQCPSKYFWKYGEWSKCNQTCGDGFQQRQAQCINEFEDPVSNVHCNDIPFLVQRCENQPCPSYKYEWTTTAWSECSVTCGAGIKRRLAKCKRTDIGKAGEDEKEHSMLVVTDEYCRDSNRPDEYINCQVKDCEQSYFWVPGPWGECNLPCDKKGRQKRVITCFNRNSRKVNRRHCKSLHMPTRKRKCYRGKCGFMSCSDVLQKLGKTAVDKEYTLYVAGRNISIYCHDMHTQRPVEFLTLPSGESENYSEFYEKRLLNPDTCPFNGKKRRDCPCVDDRVPDAGETAFSKIRLNISSLEVFTTDYTFSRQLWGKPIPYGEAGDCYSRAKCPQGRFSINLTGTGLRVSSTTVWGEYKRRPHTSVRTNNLEDGRKVIGLCGGYCGRCKVNQSLKLDILPP